MTDRRVVVTGLGTVNPIGRDVDSFWKNVQSGVSGVGRISAFDASHLKVSIAAEVADFDAEDYLERKDARRMDRYSQFFWAATSQAMADSGLDLTDDEETATRAGVAVGSGIGGVISFQEQLDVMRDRGADRISPFAIPMIISNMAAGLASISFNLLGPNTAAVTACAASANALGDAAAVIRRGDADIMVAGGAEAPICEFAVGGFANTRALSTRNDDPAGASRPFDSGRDGFVMAEGAAVLVLEERERALARGATIYGELTGYGMSADAYHMTLPRPGGMGAARAMQAAIDDAGIGPSDIDYINAHGTSTPANDATETAAIKLVLGEEDAHRIPISSTKSMTGHLLGGAGALESLVCLLAIRDGVLPPTINYDDPDPDCDLDYVPNEAREMKVNLAMNNAYAFGGTNASLILRQCQS